MLTVLYLIVFTVFIFWVGLFVGRGYRTSRRSLAFTLPPGARLFREGVNARRTERVNLSVPILVTGVDANGEKFEESTHTVTISGYGASILLHRAVKPPQEITIHRVDKSRDANVRVLHELAKSEAGHLYGVAFVDPAADLWGACQLLTEALQKTANQGESGPKSA